MKLFEVDLGAVRSVLSVLQGIADEKGDSYELDFDTFKNLTKSFGLAINSLDAVEQLKNLKDVPGDVIQNVDKDRGIIILNTKKPSQIQPQNMQQKSSGPTLNQMAASGAKKLTPDI